MKKIIFLFTLLVTVNCFGQSSTNTPIGNPDVSSHSYIFYLYNPFQSSPVLNRQIIRMHDSTSIHFFQPQVYLDSIPLNSGSSDNIMTIDTTTGKLGILRYRNLKLSSTSIITGLGYIPYNSTNPSGYLSSINSSLVISALGFTPYSNTNPSGYIGTSYTGFDSRYYPLSSNPEGYITSSYTPTINNGVSRPVNGTTYTISTTKQVFVAYNIKISCTTTIGSSSDGKVALQYSTNSGSTWIDCGEVENSNTVTLAIALNAISIQSGVIVAYIPANALVRMNSITTGTTTITYIRGQETY